MASGHIAYSSEEFDLCNIYTYKNDKRHPCEWQCVIIPIDELVNTNHPNILKTAIQAKILQQYSGYEKSKKMLMAHSSNYNPKKDFVNGNMPYKNNINITNSKIDKVELLYWCGKNCDEWSYNFYNNTKFSFINETDCIKFKNYINNEISSEDAINEH
jgi:hypothetical protein